IHANAVDALIRNDFKQEIADWSQLCLLFLICFSLVFFFCKQRVLISTIIWILVTIGAIVSSYFMYQIGYLLHLVWIPVSVTIIYIGMIAWNYVAETIEKNRIMNTFKHYVAPEIVNKILESEEDLELGGKMTDIAVLFVDIRGFTSMSEVVSPLEVVEILNRYLDLTSRCILRNKGTLDKFVGDATMAIFNAPVKQEDYVYQAVKTAWDMVKESHALNQELIEKYGRTVGFGIGVHCGQAVVGNIGAKIRMDYTAIGDTVNTASRLESNAPAGQILISRAVADQLEGRIKVTSLGNAIKLKGKAEGFEVLRLEGLMEE
ncbi:MAG: adenylate/guanylate cyclase domain-containing protein, partial [Clostridiales bacterium]|nr:adenylate/guanylate cyclase domain-containing protein [Clostridiales bacterium]